MVAAVAGAQTPRCDDLSGAQRRLADELMATEYVYECCDDTIERCLQRTPTSALAVRLADAVCRRVSSGQDEARIRRGLSRRARSMVGSGTPAEIDVSAAPGIGATEAPVTVVVYACARCPYCSRLVPALHRELTGGALEGEMRMVFRTFPIRGHEGSTEGGLAFVAAQSMGSFWPFLLFAYERFDDFDPGGQVEWAAELGLDREEFGRLMAAPDTRAALVASKKEGLVNGVEETPTLFINGRRWVGDLELDALVDAIAEEAARVRGELCEPPRMD
jgi:protein-disulfide isomerase